MRVARVVGNVTLNRCHPSFRGAHLKLVVPLSTQDLLGPGGPPEDTLVAWDMLGAGAGNFIALAEGPEAAQPFLPDVKPVDAYAAGILDQLDVDRRLVQVIVEPTRPGTTPST
ncbi:MAG: carbon dioxide concentrating mechanism protein CcmL [Pirellulaceae bacterium]|jgi:ethanolamine utilization protein EutN|nr:carbon dioxide concentrating mechanism protein CcmL [Pirellulaceae bacterium]